MSDASAVPSSRDSSGSSLACRVVATVLVGLGAGLGGLALSLLLHGIQHVAYGYEVGRFVGHTSFLDGVRAADPMRRLQALLACGAVAGLGWWALDRYGSKRVDIAKAIDAAPPRMPIVTTLVHALLQIVTVALGSPLGREVAPREVGATFASWMSQRLGLDAAESRVLLACGAGAGLAAVYNVPLAGAVFVLETLLLTFAWRALLPAFATSTIAALVARIGLGNESQYVVPMFAVDASLVAWSVAAGPVIGLAAWGFRRVTTAARPPAVPHGWKRALLALAAFAAIGLIAGPYPEVLGNGKGPAQLGFDGDFVAATALVVLALKLLALCIALRAGAYGGLLTPAVSCGALLAIALGAAWSLAWPGPASGACALVGAAAFLASSMAMPLTAILLLFEFTRIGHDFVVPVLFAVVGSVGASALCDAGQRRRVAAAAGPGLGRIR